MQSIPLWRFGPFEADAAEHQLRRDGEVVAITRKSFALLAALLSRPGKLVTKAELFDTVWAGTVVTDAALSRAIRELRIALGDDAMAPRYIATAHGLGFRFVADVSVGSPPQTAALIGTGPSPLAESRIVGRDFDLAQLDRSLADACAGRRRTVFVTGEAGIGKTTLVEAFLRRHASAASAWAAQGRCVEQYGTGEAYLPILEALEQLAHAVGADRMRDVLLRYAPAWLAQLPWLAHDADANTLRGASTEGSAHRMLREIAQALEMLAAEQPIVLWLEDLHWSDPSSLAVLAFLAGRREPARLLLMASFRPAEAQAEASPLHGLALQLVQRGQATALALEPLDEAAVGAYLRSRFGMAMQLPLESLGAFLHRRSEGNALFTVAMVDDLVRRRRLRQLDGAWALDGSVAALGDALPDDLRQLVHGQIERLPDDDRRLLEAAAVAGTDFCGASVAAALQADLASIEDRCARLAQQGRFLRVGSPVTWPDGSVSAGFSFLHALYWQATHERVPQSRRAEWQRRIGGAQERAFGPQCAPIAAELAMRFDAAGDGERTFRYSRLAAQGALARCAYQEGIDHLQRARALVPRLAVDVQARSELETLLPLGAALMMVQGYASAEVEATYEHALALCRTCGRPGDIERVQRGLWNVWFSRADLQRASAAAGELLSRARAEADAVLVFDALAKLGHTELHAGQFVAARAHLEAALAMSDAGMAYRREAPRLLAYLSWVLWYLGEPDGALACSERSLQAIGADTSVHGHALLLGHAGWVHWLRGEVDEAAGLGRRLCALSIEHGLAYWRVWGEFLVGLAGTEQGDVDAGKEAMRAATEAMLAMGTAVGITSWMYLLAEAELASGRPEAARAALARSSDLRACASRARNAADTVRVEGELALAEGGPGGAELAADCFAESVAIARSQGARSLELRVATRWAGHLASRGETASARAGLALVYAGFSEGFDTVDLRRAKALLDRLCG